MIGPGWADPQIEQLIADAAEQARTEAQAHGYAAGWAQGRQAAAEQERLEAAQREAAAHHERQHWAGQCRQLLAGLAEAMSQVQEATMPAWEQLSDCIADGALAIARAVLGRELAAVDAEVAEAVRHAMRVLGREDGVVVHVHPDDLALLQSLPDGALPPGVHLVADHDVHPGGVVARSPLHRLRVDLPAAVAAAEEVLRS